MRRLALAALVSALVWDASPSSDVAFYLCNVRERRMEIVECPPGYSPPCIQMSLPLEVTNIVEPNPDQGESQFRCLAQDPEVGQALLLCVAAVDWSGNVSGPDPVNPGAPLCYDEPGDMMPRPKPQPIYEVFP